MIKLATFIVAFLATLAVVLLPVSRMGSVPTEAQGGANAVPEYEFEVFGGLRNANNVQLSCRWHGGACLAGQLADGNALDFSAVHLAADDREVYASFRRTKGSSNLVVEFRKRRNLSLSVCKAVESKVHLEYPASNNSMVQVWIANTWYLHIDAPDTGLPKLLVDDNEPAQLVIGKVASRETCTSWTEVHLHQRTFKVSTSPVPVVVQLNRDDNNMHKGIPPAEVSGGMADPEPFPCVSSSMWLWKISSVTPAVAATDAPTNTCPPTELILTGSGDGMSLNLAFTFWQVRPGLATGSVMEIYKAVANGGFCDADADSCTPVATATPTADEDTSAFPASVAFGNLKSGKYRARGRGCAEESSPALDCGAWSAWSNTIDYVPPPRNLVLTASGRNLHLSFVADDPVELVLSGPSSTGRCPPSCIDNVKRVGAGESSAEFGMRTRGTYHVRARACTSDDLCSSQVHSNSLLHIPSPTGLGIEAGSGGLRAAFTSPHAARFELYRKENGSFCTPGEDGCDPVATATATAPTSLPISAAPRFAPFGSMDGGTYRVRARSCDAGSAGGPAGASGAGGSSGTSGERAAAGAECGAWSDWSPEFAHRVPSFGTSRAGDQSWTKGASVSLTLPAATGGDGNLTYTLTPAFPLNVTRTERNGRAFSGAPNAAKTRTMHTWTATDKNGDKDSITFHVTVNAAPAPPPTVRPTEQCTLTVYAKPPEGGTVSGGTTVNCSSSAEEKAEAEANQGYRFSHWSGDGTGAGADARTVTMSSDRSVTAHFVRDEEPPVTPTPQYTLTVRAFPASCSQGVMGNGTTHDSGDTASFSVSWKANCRFVSWSSGVTEISTSTSDRTRSGEIVMSSDRTVTATLSKIQYSLTVEANPSSCGAANGTDIYDAGTEATVSVRWNAGCSFTGWSSGVSGIKTNHRTRTSSGKFTVNRVSTVTATLSKNVYTLTARVSPGGTGTVSVSPAGPYHYGVRVTLTASPARLYYLQRWAGATATGTVNQASVTIRGNTTVTAYFRYVCNDHSHGYFGPCLQGAEEPEPPP